MIRRYYYIVLLVLLSSCHYDDTHVVPEIYSEGQQIPGTAMHFPQGQNTEVALYNGSALLPKISPDGTKLLYTGDLTLGNRGLWVMDLETQQKKLIITDGIHADWGPDSEWIYFNLLDLQIYKARIDGTVIQQLTFEGSNLYPVCSSDGNFILYHNADIKDYGVLMINAQGTRQKLIVANLGYFPAWFPNQEKFFVANGQSYDTAGILVNDASIKFRQGPGISSISPLDNRIVISTLNGIYIANPDGSLLKRIIPNHLYNNYYNGPLKLWAQNASWHPDGEHIIYEHFAIDKAIQTSDGLHIKGTMSFYKVNVDSAIMVSNLTLDGN